MVKHWLDEHADLAEPPPFHIKVISSFRESLTRQFSEPVRIEGRKEKSGSNPGGGDGVDG